jgi:hypothetical protein
MDLIDVGMTPRTGDQPCHKAATYTGQHKQKKRGLTSMPRVGFEPTSPLFDRAKTFHALDRAPHCDRPMLKHNIIK